MACILKKGKQTYDQLVNDLFARTNLDSLLSSVDKVLIKPNFVAAKTSAQAVTVDLELIRSIVLRIHQRHKISIIIGEGALLDTEAVFQSLGVYGLESAGCSVVNFEKSPWIDVAVPEGQLFRTLRVPQIAAQCDLIISLAKMKTHGLTGVTLSIKNLFGLIPRSQRLYAHQKDINHAIVDIYSYFRQKKMFSIIDGLTALSGKEGPIAGTPLETDCLIADSDAIACDTAAVRFMGGNPGDITHLKLSAERFGQDVDKLEVSTPVCPLSFEIPVNLHSVPWLGERLVQQFFYKYPVQNDSSRCVRCKKCVRICPEQIVIVDELGRFAFDPTKCVHCLCCVESCEHNAIGYKINHHWLFSGLRTAWGFVKMTRFKKR